MNDGISFAEISRSGRHGISFQHNVNCTCKRPHGTPRGFIPAVNIAMIDDPELASLVMM